MINHLFFSLFGRTESVFVPKDKLYQDPPKEARTSIRDMLVGSTAVAGIEQPPDTFNLQLKRPLDMNSLEKGPPPKKHCTQEYQGMGTRLLDRETWNIKQNIVIILLFSKMLFEKDMISKVTERKRGR